MDGEEVLRNVCEMMTRICVYSYKDEFSGSGDEGTPSTTEDGIPIRKLFIGNLAQRTTPKDLTKTFSKYGKVDSCYLKRCSGKTNYGFVTFSDVNDALKAREDGTRKQIHLHNRDLRVMPADSWHQPDSVENQRKLEAKRAKAQESADSSTNSVEQEISASESLVDNVPIHKLNDDCLIHIFLYLPISDRVRVERVCKRWRIVSLESWRAVKKLDLSPPTWGAMSKNRDPGIDTSTLRKVLLRCGQFLLHIDLETIYHRLRQSTLTIISKCCPNLQTINVSSLNISTSGIDALMHNCGDLKKMTLGSCTSSCDNDLIRLFSKNKQLQYLKINQNNLLSGKCLMHLPCNAIEEICLDECNAITSCYFSNAIVKFHKLTTLSVHACVSLNDSAIQAISSRADSLHHLELHGYFPLLTAAVMSNIANLVNLETLKVERNPVITDEFLIALAAQCVQIKQIDITGCNAVSNEGIAAIASLPKLDDLKMSYMGKVSDEVLSQMQHLKRLQCRGCPNLTDDGTAALIQLCPQLELLDLSGCDSITNSTLEVAIQATKARTNNVILKIIIGGTAVVVDELTEISPLLQIVNVDLSVHYMKPNFDHGGFFPSEDDDDDLDHEDIDNFSDDLPVDWDDVDLNNGFDYWDIWDEEEFNNDCEFAD